MKALNILKTVIIAALCSFPILANAEETVATLTSGEGVILGKRAGESAFSPVTVGTTFSAGDIIQTSNDARAGIAFSSGGFLRLAENTTLQFQAAPQEKKKSLSMNEGKAYYFSRDPENAPRIDTPSASLAIRGTEFALDVSSTKTTVGVLDGAVECENSYGRIALNKGEQGVAEKNSAPVKSILVKPLDAVQWALFYPALPQDTQVPDALKKARMSLSRGQVQEAEMYLKETEAVSTESEAKASLLSMRAVIALSNNDKERAQKLSTEALELSPRNPDALLAGSFIAQSSFRLDEAESLAARLAEARPGLAAGYARLSELAMGRGDLRGAIAQADKAKALDGSDPYVMTVHGFASLLQSKNDQALSDFNSALSIDSSFALAKLGAGLTRIHQGYLAEGRHDLEEAAFLSPNAGIYRSYLGKAFFEEYDETRAGHEFDRAINLDPLDPTPYLYRAFNQLAVNNPVGALEDAETSIDLNNNRAVYRSSLLLDQDLGVRTAGLSQVFTELGFADAARVEAIKSLSHDYSNYSAHLLLADSYRSIFLADASESERKITNMLAPLSFNLFQQRAGTATFNEYDALFDRPDERTELFFDGSSYDDLISGSVQHAQKWEEWAYTAGFEPLMTGGSKHGNYSRRYRGNASASYQPVYTDRFTLNSDILYHQIHEKELDPDDTKLEEVNADLNYLHAFESWSKLLAFASYGAKHNRYKADEAERFALIREVFEGEEFESDDVLLENEAAWDRVLLGKVGVQHVLDLDLVSVVTGAEYHNVDVKRHEGSEVLEDDLGFFDDSDYFIRTHGYNDLNSVGAYSYTTWHILPRLDLTAGVSFDSVEFEKQEITPFTDDMESENHFSPKVGLVSNPVDNLTLRAAYFESLRKSALEDNITVEPTLVGGINQRFTDISGALARNFGVGADYKIPRSTYFGAEGIQRKVRNSFSSGIMDFTFDGGTVPSSSQVLTSDGYDFQNQDFIKAYISQVISDRWVGLANYEWGKVQSTDPEAAQDMRLNKLALQTKYFESHGFFPYVTGTWRHQNRDGIGFGEFSGTSDFWIVDAGIGYRLPHRHGSVAVQLSNIFDRDFTYDQSEGIEPFVHSGIGVDLVAAVNF